MKNFVAWHQETVSVKAVEALISNNFKAVFCKDREEAVEKVLALIFTRAIDRFIHHDRS